MRSIFITTIILFLLTGCGTATQPAVPTVAQTITIPPPTSTLAPTETPVATATPESPFPEGLVEFQAKLAGSYEFQAKDNGFVLIDSKTKQEVPEITFDKNGVDIIRKYTFNNPYGSLVDLVSVIKLDKVNVLDQGDQKILDFSGWRFNGQWERETVVGDKGEETKILKYTRQEIGEIIDAEAKRLGKDKVPGMKTPALESV